MFAQYFPYTGNGDTVIVLLQRINGGAILGSDTGNFTAALGQDTGGYDCTSQESYYSLAAVGLQAAAAAHVSAAGDATYIMLECYEDADVYVPALQDTLRSLTARYFGNGATRVLLTGEPVLDRDLQSGIESDMLLCDGIAFPTALLVFCLTLGSLRLILIPLAAILTTLLTAFLIMWPVGQARGVISFAPSLMLSVTIAMCIDYSLFLMARFGEQLRRHACDTPTAVAAMLSSSGHTVLVSGATLSLCFAGLLLFPMELLSSLGLACAVAVAVAVLVNLSLTPSLILTFPKFFRNSVGASCLSRCRRGRATADTALVVNGPSAGEYGFVEEDSDLDVSLSGSIVSSTPLDSSSSRWYRVGDAMLRRPVVWLVLVCAVLAYPAYVAVTWDWTMNSMAYAPRGAESTEAFAAMEADFGSGRFVRGVLV